MQKEVKRKTGLRLKRLLSDEWAMLALLAAAAVQTGYAVSAMNGMVRSNHQVMNSPSSDAAVAAAPTPTLVIVPKNSVALARAKITPTSL